jgi:hypothetical protein
MTMVMRRTKMTTKENPTMNKSEPLSLALSCPLPCEPGETAQLFSESPRTFRILDVVMPEGTEAIGLMAGLQDVKPAEGETWSALLVREPVHVTKGQHVMVIGRNLGSAPLRITASVPVRPVDAKEKPPVSGRSASREITSRGPEAGDRRLAEPIARSADEPSVRFLIERAYVTYIVSYIQNGAALPRALRAAIGTSFESNGAVVDRPPARLGSSVIVEMPSAIRAAIGASIRNAGPLGLHPEDVGTALDALTRAIATDRPHVSSASSVTSGAVEHARSVERDRAPGTLLVRPVEGAAPVNGAPDLLTEMMLMKNTLLSHEMRIADLEAGLRGRTDDAPTNPNQLPLLTVDPPNVEGSS